MNFYYNELPTKNKETSCGVKMRKCECGGRTYLIYEEDENYKVVCENCTQEYKLKGSSVDGAILYWNNLLKDFDGLISCGKFSSAARLFAENYYRGGKMGYTRKMLIDKLADISDLYDKSVDDGFYLTKENYEKLLENKLKSRCEYCISIDNATKKSPRKKYKYCPMCGRRRG